MVAEPTEVGVEITPGQGSRYTITLLWNPVEVALEFQPASVDPIMCLGKVAGDGAAPILLAGDVGEPGTVPGGPGPMSS